MIANISTPVTIAKVTDGLEDHTLHIAKVLMLHDTLLKK